MTTKSLPAITLLNLRQMLNKARSTNGLVSAKLHRVRGALDGLLAPTRTAYDETAQRHAKRNDADQPIAIPGSAYLLTGTPAYEMVDEAAFNADLVPILTESLSFSFVGLTDADLVWITTEDDIGAALDLIAEAA